MTTDVDDRVRRAIDDIVDAAGDIGPCPTLSSEPITLRRHARNGDGSGRTGSRTGASGGRRWVAVAATLLIVAGMASVALMSQRRDATTTSPSGLIDVGPVERFPAGSVVFIEVPPLFVVNDVSTEIVVFDGRSTHLECVLVPNDPNSEASVGVPDPDVEFIDPCHGSIFDRAGNTLAGPAPRSMDRYRFEITDQRVMVDLSQPIPGDPATGPVYSAADLDLSLPVVGRGWADSMDFSLDRDTNARLYNAWQTAIANCMHTRGFPDHQAVTYPDNGSYEDLVNPLDRRYATVMGYHPLPADPVDPNPYTDDAAVTAGDCSNSVWNDTFGRFNDYWDVNDQLRMGIGTAIDGFADSDAGRTATTDWAACMGERGHEFGSRLDAILTYVDRPTVSAREISTRLDDLDCDIAVSYTQRQHDWEQARIETWRVDNADTIDIALEQKQLLEEQLPGLEADVHDTQN